VNQEILKELISDHANHPRNHYRLEGSSCQCHGKNPLCGDEVTLNVLLSGDESIIEKIAFEGRGCPISQASASLLTEVCSGLSVNGARSLAQYLRSSITGNPTGNLSPSLTGAWHEIEALSTIQINPARVKCVTLAWHTLLQALEQRGTTQTVC
jgi:nitrogen fixation NifU-like protein